MAEWLKALVSKTGSRVKAARGFKSLSHLQNQVMYLFFVEIKESEIDGKGVFTVEKINKGQIVWKFNANHDKSISQEEFDVLDDVVKAELRRIAYLSPTTNRYVYPPINDAARFTNHSPNNNLSVFIDKDISEEPYFVANRDIEAREELTNNYLEFDEALKKYRPEWITS